MCANTQTTQIGPDISFILNKCKNAGNMGAAARAIKNMGINKLLFVRPKRELWLEAIKMAAGAEDVLEQTVIFGCIEDALADKHLVIGTTHRARKYRSLSYSLQELTEEIMNLPSFYEVAFLFGNERTGLTNKEINLCQKLVAIPTINDFPSINLAQSVMIIAFQCLMARKKRRKRMDSPLVSDFIGFFEHLENVLNKGSYFDKYPKLNFMHSIAEIVYRANLSKREIHFLRGILSYLDPQSKKF
ncbi:MAG: RNA methyltransferase [bacterium]